LPTSRRLIAARRRYPFARRPASPTTNENAMTVSPDQRDAKKAARRERRRALARARYHANRDRILADKRLKYRTDPEYRVRMLAEASKRDRRQDALRWKYGLSPEAYDRMFKRQHGLCLICWKPFTSTPHVDHDHDSGFVRALFCDNCNIGCGRFFDNPFCAVPPRSWNSSRGMKSGSCASRGR
jgi:hypothetical protein